MPKRIQLIRDEVMVQLAIVSCRIQSFDCRNFLIQQSSYFRTLICVSCVSTVFSSWPVWIVRFVMEEESPIPTLHVELGGMVLEPLSADELQVRVSEADSSVNRLIK